MRKYKDMYKHEGKYYTKEKRVAKVGELVLITHSISRSFKDGDVLTVIRPLGGKDLVMSNEMILSDSEYVVLVPHINGMEITDTWYDEMSQTEKPKLVCPYCLKDFDCRTEPYCSHCGEPVFHNKVEAQPVPFSKEYYGRGNGKSSRSLENVPIGYAIENINAGDMLTLDAKTGAIKKAIVASNFRECVPEKRKWTDAEIQEARVTVLSYNLDTKYMCTSDPMVIGAYYFNTKTKRYQCATAICMKNDTFDYWIGRMVACLKVHDKQLPEWIKGG